MASRGEIIFDSPSPAVDCRVSNMTIVSATLTVPAGTVVPDAITLAIAGEFVMRRCRVGVAPARPGRRGVRDAGLRSRGPTSSRLLGESPAQPCGDVVAAPGAAVGMLGAAP